MSSTQTRTLEYTVGDKTMRSVLAWDESRDGAEDMERPGILVFPEWWGMNSYIEGRAEQLAELGFTAMGVDMYGDGFVADTPDNAASAMNGVLSDMSSGQARIHAAHEALRAQPQTDATRTAAIGYCFGGAMVLHAARVGMDLKAVVSFHGSLGSFHTPPPGSVKAHVLVCHGGADSLVPEEDISALKEEMNNANANFEFISYEGALHSFTNPDATAKGEKYGLPLAYDETTERQSWQDMQALFKRVF